MPATEFSLAVAALGFLLTWTCTVAWLVWWLSKQFTDTRNTMYGVLAATKTEILEELEKIEARLDKHDERIRKVEVEQASWPALIALAEKQKK